jgi:colanic acid/amylovoran biosynthesis glycosyltransferase
LLPTAHPSRPDAGAEKPRIAYLLSRYPAVSHTFFLKEVLELRARGLDIRVASINPPDRPPKDLPEIEAAESAQTYYIKSSGYAGIFFQLVAIVFQSPAAILRGIRAALSLGGWDLKARAYAFFYLAEALMVGRWMRHNSLGHLHVHFGGPVATVGMLASKAWRVPWSITLHGPDEFFDQEAFYLAQKIKSASFVICISDFCRSQVLRIAPNFAAEQLEIVRLGVDCIALRPATPAPIVNDSAPVRLVCTGRLVAAKGHRILLEAISESASSLSAAGIKVSCAFIGDGPERSALEALSRRLGIAESVRFVGARAHAPTLAEVAAADIFVLASFAEGLPVALMEAMALGVSCVSTTIAAIPELIRSGENGVLVPPANPSALSSALEKLARDPELRRQLGLRGRVTVETEYNLARNLDTLAAVWRQKLGSNL